MSICPDTFCIAIRKGAAASLAFLAGTLGLGLWGCAAPSAVVIAARQGDLIAYQNALDEALSPRLPNAQKATAGSFEPKEAVSLSRAVLTRELTAIAPGNEFSRLQQVSLCAEELTGQLAEIAAGQGQRAVAAQWQLAVQGNGAKAQRPKRTASRSRAERWRLMAQGSEDARRTAIVEALLTRHPEDLGPLLEVARLDPSSRNRSLAVAAVGSIGGRRASQGLADIWQRADIDGQRAILQAWSVLKTYDSGGQAQLVEIAEGPVSEMAIMAALALQERAGGPPGLSGNVLHSALRSEDSGLQAMVLRRAIRLDNASLAADVQLLLAEATPVTALALYRAAELKPLTAERIEALQALRTGDDPEAAHWARLALLRQKNLPTTKAIFPQLVTEMQTAPTSDRRVRAATALLTFYGPIAAVRALADDSPRVRTEMACRILIHAR